jgi:hypothetical protein
VGNGGARRTSWGWRRTNPFKDWFELRAGSRVLATLALEGITITSAVVDVDGHRFTLSTEGVGSQRIKICNTAEQGGLIANFDRNWSGRAGTLRFAQGGRLEWRRVGWWRPTWIFADRFGNPLVRLRPDGGIIDCVLGEELVTPTGSRSDVLLLLALAWFLLVIGGHAVPPRLASAM